MGFIPDMWKPPRQQLFEFNDAAWAPGPLKALIVESLSRTLRWGRVLRGIVSPFLELMNRSGCSEVLDLAAGAGGPAQVLVEEILAHRQSPPHFLLSDLQPRVHAWTTLAALHPREISFIPSEVDATRLPPGLAEGRVTLVINAIHHFPPSLARQVLLEAAHTSKGVFVAEGLLRDPRGLMAMAVTGIPALLAAPLLEKDDRLVKAALMWLTPAGFAASLWDGTVSTLRQYDEDELRELVRDGPPGWRWEYGVFQFPFGGRGSWFRGAKS